MAEPRASDNKLFETMIAAAIEGGRLVHAIYRGEFTVQSKAVSSPVTDADHAAEEVILRRL
jgi:3'-phosphoadenosine 5'-phosphosulfate (PAPS) 3'-phosphatase